MNIRSNPARAHVHRNALCLGDTIIVDSLAIGSAETPEETDGPVRSAQQHLLGLAPHLDAEFETKIAATAKITLARYAETAKRINAELDETGSMDLFRAGEITREVINEHWHKQEVVTTAHWLRGPFVAEARKHERPEDVPAPDDYRETGQREAWEAMARFALRAGMTPPPFDANPFPWEVAPLERETDQLTKSFRTDLPPRNGLPGLTPPR